MTEPESRPVTAFRPLYENCDRHGQYQANRQRADGTEEHFGHCPRCRAEAGTKLLVQRAAIPVRFQDRTFESFKVENEGQRHALAIAQGYAETFATHAVRRGTCLVFVGNPGCGKTHLACAIAMHLQREGFSALFLTVLEAIRKVRASWGRKGATEDEDEVLRQLAALDLLILDEVGVQYGTQAEETTLTEIINRRYQDCRPTILLSNLPLVATAGEKTLRDFLGARAYDRMREGGGAVVPFDWSSMRGSV